MTWTNADYDLTDPRTAAAVDDTPLWSAPFGVRLLEVVDFRPHLRALDVGSGLGFPLLDLAQRLGPTALACGLDPWAPGQARAREKMDVLRIRNAAPVSGVAESMPFPDDVFDLVTSNNGTNNVADEAKALDEIARVAKPGAQFVLTQNLPETMHEFYAVFREVLRRRGDDEAVDRIDTHIFEKRKPLDHVTASLTAAGFAIESMHEDSFTLRFTDGTAMLSSPMIQIGFRDSWLRIPAAHEVAAVFDDVEALLNERAAGTGLTLTIPWACIDARRR